MARKPIIGFVTTGLSSRGGMDRCSQGLIEATARREDVGGVKAVTAATVKNETTVKDVFPSLGGEDFGLLNQWRTFRACMKHLRGCDMIHCLIEAYGPGAALAAMFLRVPFVITIAATYAVPPSGWGPKAIIKREIMRFMYRRAVCVATGSNRNIEMIHKVMTLENWKFVPFGVDYSRFATGKTYPKPERPFILTVGELKPRKGADVTIKALAKLKDEFPELEYKIVGNPEIFKRFVEHCKKLAEESGIKDRVIFTGRITDEKLIELYHQCEVFVLAAQVSNESFEGFPMVFYEAHSCGAPVVSTYGFGSEYVIENGRNGYLVQPDNVDELAGAIRKVVSDPAHRAHLSGNARKEAQKHTWDYIAELYRDIYRSGGIQ